MAALEAEGFVLDEFLLEARGVGEDVGTAEMIRVIIKRAGTEGGTVGDGGDSLPAEEDELGRA